MQQELFYSISLVLILHFYYDFIISFFRKPLKILGGMKWEKLTCFNTVDND